MPDEKTPGQWKQVNRDGTRKPVAFKDGIVTAYAEKAAGAFGIGANHAVSFDKARAKEDAKKADKKSKTA